MSESRWIMISTTFGGIRLGDILLWLRRSRSRVRKPLVHAFNDVREHSVKIGVHHMVIEMVGNDERHVIIWDTCIEIVGHLKITVHPVTRLAYAELVVRTRSDRLLRAAVET